MEITLSTLVKHLFTTAKMKTADLHRAANQNENGQYLARDNANSNASKFFFTSLDFMYRLMIEIAFLLDDMDSFVLPNNLK